MWPTATPPSGWLICNGTLVARATYPNLRNAFAADGYIWGAGDGSTTMALPNFVDNSPIGAGNLYALASAHGEAAHTLTAAEMPVHAHGVTDPGHGHGVSDPGHAHSGDLAQSVLLNDTPGPMGGANVLAGTAGGSIHYALFPPLSINGAGTGISIVGAGTGISIQNAGSGASHNNLHPVKGIHYIIRAY